MKRKIFAGFVSILLIAAFIACSGSKESGAAPASGTQAAAQAGGAPAVSGPVTMDIATMAMGSAWYSYGAILSELITNALPAGSRINVTPESGAAANPIMVAQGDFPMAIGFNQSCSWAYNGTFIYPNALTNLRGLVGYLDTYFYGAVVSNAFGYTDLAEVKAKKIPIRVSTVPVGGLGEVVTKLIFEYYGMTYDDIRSWGGKVEHNDFNTIVDLFKDGQTDFFLQNITVGHAAVTELAVTVPVTFLKFPEEMITSFVEKYGFSREILPANSFNGQTEDIPSMGLTSNLFTSTDMPDGVAYAIAKAIAENPDSLHRGHVAMARFSPQTAADPVGLGLPLHPGAEKYYREAGLLK